MRHSILVVDDDALIRETLTDLLDAQGYEVEDVASAEAALGRIEERDFACVLSDLQMPGMDGLGLLGALRERHPEIPTVMMTGFGSIDTAVEAMRLGAQDFVTKPFQADRLRLTIERAFEKRELEEENKRLRAAVDRIGSCGDLVGKSAAMNEIYALVRKIGRNASTVLITGESGTGKEVVAQTIHFSGDRADKPFVPINCTAMPEGLLESEFFGHARGAFTGAQKAKKGLIEEAEGGTLFLDEIAEMSPSLQGKLLRVLQDHEIRPVGGNDSVDVDVRVIAATNRDLRAEIQAGRFREDLFYRLNVIPIHMPSLRERPDDIPPLAQAFVERKSGDMPRVISERAMQKLQSAPWPGNVRELENCIERSLVLSDGPEIQARDILISDEPSSGDDSLEASITRLARERRVTLHDFGEYYIDAVLEFTRGRKSEAARILGINRRTLYRREDRLKARAEA
jgi:DNA-binding NtrC family response regulator